MSASLYRGHAIEKDDSGVYRFVDTGEPVPETWKSRPCGICGLHNTPEGHDGCLGTIPGVRNACCGHGVEQEAYVQFEDGREDLRGASAVAFFASREAPTHQGCGCCADNTPADDPEFYSAPWCGVCGHPGASNAGAPQPKDDNHA